MGTSFASRVAASILKAVELPELVTDNLADYEVRAVALATEPGLLNEVKQRLLANRLTAPLFNTGLYARAIEDAYTRMLARLHAGQPPEDI